VPFVPAVKSPPAFSRATAPPAVAAAAQLSRFARVSVRVRGSDEAAWLHIPAHSPAAGSGRGVPARLRLPVVGRYVEFELIHVFTKGLRIPEALRISVALVPVFTEIESIVTAIYCFQQGPCEPHLQRLNHP
jgi:hypothetical protein